MAAWVEATTREIGQSLINPDKPSVSVPGDTEKPALNLKPHLTAKPFSLQRNATVRPIRAPKTNFSKQLHRAASSDTLLNTTDTHAGGLETSDSNGTVNGSDQSAAPKPVPLSPKPDLQAKPKPETTKSPDATGSNDQTGPNSKLDVTAEDMKNVQLRSRAKSIGSRDQKILNQKEHGAADVDVKVPSRCWPARNRLSADLTSKFQSPPQPDTVGRDVESSKTEKEEQPLSPSAVSEPKSPVENEEAGCSIKRRITLLFDRSAASQCRDTINKRDITPAEISIDIKQRIQNLSLDTRLPSTGAPKSPPYEETNERSSGRETEKVPVDKPPNTPEIKNSAASVENAEEEEDNEVEEDKENYVTVPVKQRVRMSIDAEKKQKEEEEKKRKDEQLEKERQQQQERGTLLEEERKAKEIKRQLEEERKQEEERQRLMEERRKQEEDWKRKIEEERKEEERRRQAEKERERQQEQEKLERERQIEEEKRRTEEEKERQREEEQLRQENLKKEREMEEERRRIQEMERQKEEERLRQEREKEERLKKEREMEEERRRVQEVERQKEEEKLRKEREMERIRKEKEMEKERLKEEERLRQEQEIERIKKEKEMEEERLKEEERLRQEREKERLKKEKEMEEERRRIQEVERQKEEERLRKEREMEKIRKEKEMEEERRKEEERLRQEREKERVKKEKEMEQERQRIQEIERQKEEERLRQERVKEEQLKKDREMEEERLKEEERLRQEREKDRLKKEMEEERQRIQEMERQKEEERLRQELVKEECLKKEREMEEERRRVQEMERQKEEEKLRKEREMERIRKEKEMEEERRRLQEMEKQKEKERLRKEQEMERIRKEKEMEEERRRLQEMEKQKEEEKLRKEREMERIRKEKEMEEERRRLKEMERQKEEERLRKEREMERIKKEREIEERKRMEEERLRQEREREKERLKKEEENLRKERENDRLKKETEMERCKSVEILREEVPTSFDLISFDASEPAASQTLVSSVSPQLTEVLYDDFSVKPRRWGTGARRSLTPSPSREPEQNLQPEPQDNDPGSQGPCGERVNVEDLMGFEPEASSPQNSSCKHTTLSESKPEDLLVPETESDEGQLKDCEPEEVGVAKQDTESLIGETDEQSENNDDVDGLGTESRIGQALHRLTRVRRRNTSTDSNTPDVPDEEESKALPVLESAAPLLDSSVLRSKVDLAKKRSIKRSRPTRAVRQRGTLFALTEGTNPDWRFCDSTDAKDQCSNGGDSESEEEPSRDAVSSPAPCKPKRVPMFPGIDPSALMAQLKRRSGVVEAESPTEPQTPPSVPARSPRTPNMTLGPRVLPPVDAKDSASGSSPSWLLELKSKKRLNQPESEA
ncbi:182 kDa tankyrase-1-binding protein isoform X1 [Siphateles boraxobius]|uniref:182 kDa tankyrase-1-binding protein isoform X1 n=1 Tax=Siphateles boraxobius TaxID=180520 RepID=UPI004063CA13